MHPLFVRFDVGAGAVLPAQKPVSLPAPCRTTHSENQFLRILETICGFTGRIAIMWKVRSCPRLVDGTEGRSSLWTMVSQPLDQQSVRGLDAMGNVCGKNCPWEPIQLWGSYSQRGCSCLRFSFVDNNMPKIWLCVYATNLLSDV